MKLAFEKIKSNPDQLRAVMADASTTIYCGGNQCLGGNSVIYDPVRDTYRRVCDINGPHFVVAWNSQEVVALAGKPFVKAFGSVYRVGLSNGESFEASLEHEVFSSQREYLSVGSIQSQASPSLLASTWRNGQLAPRADGLRYAQTILDSQSDYLPYRHFYDEQPHRALSIGQDELPSQAGVLERTERRALQMDGHRNSEAHNLRGQPSCRPSSKDVRGRVAQRTERKESHCVCALEKHLSDYSQGAAQFLGHAGRFRSTVLKAEHSTSSTRPLEPLKVWVVSILYLREDAIWDFEVPLVHNYMCAGVFHHNSGKTFAAAFNMLAHAMGRHPSCDNTWNPKWGEWEGWWGTQTYDMFGAQCWKRCKEMLLFPDEDPKGGEITCPTRYILAIGYLSKNPEIPNYIKLRRADGNVASINIKSYEQGRAAWQGKEVNLLNFDEEHPTDIYHEGLARLAARNGRLCFSLTPIEGQCPHVEDLRERAEAGDKTICFVRLKTQNNPTVSKEYIDRVKFEWRHMPEMARLRLEGYPISVVGLVYNDALFTPAHVCDPFAIPWDWTRFITIDHGFQTFAALWGAVSPGNKERVIYREYKGEFKSISQNAATVLALTGAERIKKVIIDKATNRHDGFESESGDAVKTIDAYRAAGLPCRPSPPHGVWAGIQEVWRLLAERVLDNSGAERPHMRIFNTCQYILKERREYRTVHVEETDPNKGEVLDKILKKKDHFMDCWRYLIVDGWKWSDVDSKCLPSTATTGGVLWKARMDALPGRRKAFK